MQYKLLEMVLLINVTEDSIRLINGELERPQQADRIHAAIIRGIWHS